MIELYFAPTPNGQKVTILLEEAEILYRLVPIHLSRGDQFTPEFLKLNPNHRMPTMVDSEPEGGGGPIAVFESGAIVMYLAEKSGKFWPQDIRTKHEVTQWVIWQMANQGPKYGEAGHFRRLGDTQGDQSYAVRRFADEVNRLYGVLNYRLYDRPYLAGDAYTIADMIAYPWAARYESYDEDISNFKHFKRWFDELGGRPAVQRGMAAGKEIFGNVPDPTPEEQERMKDVLYNQRAIPAPDEKQSALRAGSAEL